MVKSLTKRFHAWIILLIFSEKLGEVCSFVRSELKQFYALFVRVVKFFCVKTCGLSKNI